MNNLRLALAGSQTVLESDLVALESMPYPKKALQLAVPFESAIGNAIQTHSRLLRPRSCRSAKTDG